MRHLDLHRARRDPHRPSARPVTCVGRDVLRVDARPARRGTPRWWCGRSPSSHCSVRGALRRPDPGGRPARGHLQRGRGRLRQRQRRAAPARAPGGSAVGAGGADRAPAGRGSASTPSAPPGRARRRAAPPRSAPIAERDRRGQREHRERREHEPGRATAAATATAPGTPRTRPRGDLIGIGLTPRRGVARARGARPVDAVDRHAVDELGLHRAGAARAAAARRRAGGRSPARRPRRARPSPASRPPRADPVRARTAAPAAGPPAPARAAASARSRGARGGVHPVAACAGTRIPGSASGRAPSGCRRRPPRVAPLVPPPGLPVFGRAAAHPLPHPRHRAACPRPARCRRTARG